MSKWFDKYKTFREELLKEIEKSKDDIQFIHSIKLQDVVKNLGDVIPEVHKWADIISRLKSYISHLEVEFDELDAMLFLELKHEMILEQDERKRKNLKVYTLTNDEVKMKRQLNRARQSRLHKLKEVQNILQYIESCCFWPSVNSIQVLHTMAKFSIAREKEYNSK